MTDDFDSREARSSGELWSEICSSLPEVQAETAPENKTEFKDSFQPTTQVGVQVNGQSNGTSISSPSAKWEPMEDSEIYIASLGIVLLLLCPFHDCRPHVPLGSPCFPSTWSCHPSYILFIQVVWELGEMIGLHNPSITAQLPLFWCYQLLCHHQSGIWGCFRLHVVYRFFMRLIDIFKNHHKY